jgi:excinuclease ABC subunit C
MKINHLPDTPGIYIFKKGKGILYIGKATSLKDRVKSYMSKGIFDTRGPLIEKMLQEADRVEFIQTDSVLEALILEAHEIKKHQPLYNSKEKDDKSYNYITITKEEFPKMVVTRGSGIYGPFPHGAELKEVLKIIRKIFPYRDSKCKITGKPCFNAQIGLCPGPCAGKISKKDYRKIIHHIKLFFKAKKPQLIKSLEKEMEVLTLKQQFEEAGKVKKQILALDHIQDVALIKTDFGSESSFRIEGYDVAHLSGTGTVGVMTVVEAGELNKSQYRKFKIRIDSNDDTNNLKEIITRRLSHLEWPLPNLIVVDGGRGQINIARKVIKKAGLDIEVVSVVKDEKHKAREIMGSESVQSSTLHKEILLANAEAHRFAIGYHRKLRSKGFRL